MCAQDRNSEQVSEQAQALLRQRGYVTEGSQVRFALSLAILQALDDGSLTGDRARLLMGEAGFTGYPCPTCGRTT